MPKKQISIEFACWFFFVPLSTKKIAVWTMNTARHCGPVSSKTEGSVKKHTNGKRQILKKAKNQFFFQDSDNTYTQPTVLDIGHFPSPSK